MAGWHVPSLAVALPQLVGAIPADHGERLCAILWAGPRWGLEAFGDPRASRRVCPLRREHPRVWGAAFPRGFPWGGRGRQVGPGEGGGQPVPRERSLSGCKIQIKLFFFFFPQAHGLQEIQSKCVFFNFGVWGYRVLIGLEKSDA